MRTTMPRGVALAAVAVLALSACGDDGGDDGDQAAPEEAENGEGSSEGEQGQQDVEDPNEDVEDGVYRGSGVVLPVPEGWSLNPQVFSAQGALVAEPDSSGQQLSAQAFDKEELEEQRGQPLEFDALLEQLRAEQEPDVDEEVELAGAERAHRVSFYELESSGQATGPEQEEAPAQSVTLLLAESGDGVIAQFVLTGVPADTYDEDVEELLLAEAGIDPDSEPPELPQMQQPPAPQGGDGQGSGGGQGSAEDEGAGGADDPGTGGSDDGTAGEEQDDAESTEDEAGSADDEGAGEDG